jgi:hypothetical protein
MLHQGARRVTTVPMWPFSYSTSLSIIASNDFKSAILESALFAAAESSSQNANGRSDLLLAKIGTLPDRHEYRAYLSP